MPPEVLSKAIELSGTSLLSCDVYSFSLVLWEMLSRCHIAEGKCIFSDVS